MSSNINPTIIDATYPVAGQDNDSQGFRDNFTVIKNNFTAAKEEITDLQNKVVLKAALSGGVLDNDMAGAVFESASIKDQREVVHNLNTSNGTITLNHATSHYQYASSNTGNITLAFSNFPAAGSLGRILFEINVTDTTKTLTLPAEVSVGTVGLLGLAGNLVTFPTTGVYKYEFISRDGGSTVAINEVAHGRQVNSNLVLNESTTNRNGNFNLSDYMSVSANANAAVTSMVFKANGNIVFQTQSNTYVKGRSLSMHVINLSGNALTHTIGNITSNKGVAGNTFTQANNVVAHLSFTSYGTDNANVFCTVVNS